MWNVIKQEMKLHVDVGLNWIDHNLKEMKLPTDTLGSGRDYDNCPAFLDKNDKLTETLCSCAFENPLAFEDHKEYAKQAMTPAKL